MKSTSPVTTGWVYHAPATVSRFMESDAFGRLITGPVGSGKTTACLVEMARRMGQQAPGFDGRQVHTLCRDTADPQRRQDDSGEGCQRVVRFSCRLEGIRESTLYIDYGDIVSEWIFIPLEEPSDIKRLLSTQLTGAFINEAVEIDVSLLSDISGRCGRYPSNEFGVCTWKGIFADTNMPIQRTPWADFILSPPPLWQVFRQPSGLADDAENLPHLNQNCRHH